MIGAILLFFMYTLIWIVMCWAAGLNEESKWWEFVLMFFLWPLFSLIVIITIIIGLGYATYEAYKRTIT
jgi:hypothetical protein